MLFGLQEVALPSMSEAKRAWTLIQLLRAAERQAVQTRLCLLAAVLAGKE
jgi:hypothetical protein